MTRTAVNHMAASARQDFALANSDIVKAKQVRGYSLAEFQDRIRSARNAEDKVPLLFAVGPKGKNVPRKLVAVALARTEGK